MIKILIVKISSMGDILNTLPALTDAINKIPNISFDWVVEEDFAQIPSWHPAVDRVLIIAIRRWKKNWFGKKERKERSIFRKTLQLYNYDIIIDAQGLIKSSLFVTRLVKGIKHGYNISSARELLSTLCYDKTYKINTKQHAVEKNRDLFSKILMYNKPKKKGKYLINYNFIPLINKNLYNYIIFFYSTTKKDKHWPEDYWIDLINSLKFLNLRIKLFWKSKSELNCAKRLALNFSYVDISPKLNLYEIGRQIIGAVAIVSVDTGLSNLASALDKQNIILYGPTIPILNGGYGKKQYYLIAPKHDLSKLKPIVVISKLKSLLNNIYQK